MPNTKYAANAAHRLHEINRALAAGETPPEISEESESELPPGEAKTES